MRKYRTYRKHNICNVQRTIPLHSVHKNTNLRTYPPGRSSTATTTHSMLILLIEASHSLSRDLKIPRPSNETFSIPDNTYTHTNYNTTFVLKSIKNYDLPLHPPFVKKEKEKHPHTTHHSMCTARTTRKQTCPFSLPRVLCEANSCPSLTTRRGQRLVVHLLRRIVSKAKKEKMVGIVETTLGTRELGRHRVTETDGEIRFRVL